MYVLKGFVDGSCARLYVDRVNGGNHNGFHSCCGGDSSDEGTYRFCKVVGGKINGGND